jgi:hypothetical protein
MVPAVVTVTLTVVAPDPLSFTELGETEHEAIDGAPAHVSATVWSNPPPGDTATLYCAVCPGATVAFGDDTFIAKSCPIPVRVEVCGLSVALSVTVSVPVRVPVVDGSKNTPIEQLWPAGRLLPQPLSALKSLLGVAVTFEIASAVVPVL